jgi:hypothetical protein
MLTTWHVTRKDAWTKEEVDSWNAGALKRVAGKEVSTSVGVKFGALERVLAQVV